MEYRDTLVTELHKVQLSFLSYRSKKCFNKTVFITYNYWQMYVNRCSKV